MALHGQQIIGQQRRRAGEPCAWGHDAATGAKLEPGFADATREEIDAALRFAVDAQRANAGVSAERRAAFLEGVATQIEALGDALIERAMAESGLPRGRLVGERGRTVSQLRKFAAVVREGSWVAARIDPAQPERSPMPRADLRRMLVPLGPVAVFGASNFPLAFSVAGGDTASALAAGCPVIAKAHPSHPGTSELVGEAIVAAVAKAELHPGTFALIHGASHEVGQALVEHPALRAVGFTGSLRGGQALYRLAAQRPVPIPVFAEMGSINPVVFLPGALAARGEALAQQAAGSLTLGVGQFCTNPGLMLVPEGEAGDRFVAKLASALAKVEAGVMLDANILRSYCTGVEDRAKIAGVERVTAGVGTDERALPTLFATTASRFTAEPKLHEELFGPAGLVVRWGAQSGELDALIGSLEGQLSATIHASEDDAERAAELAPRLAACAGRLVWNGFPTGVEVCPAMQHGGPWPASSDARTTSVGSAAIERFARPLCWQDAPASTLPPELRDDNPRGILRLVDGVHTRAGLGE